MKKLNLFTKGYIVFNILVWLFTITILFTNIASLFGVFLFVSIILSYITYLMIDLDITKYNFYKEFKTK